MEVIISNVLRFGVMISTLVITGGIVAVWINEDAKHHFLQVTLPVLKSGSHLGNEQILESYGTIIIAFGLLLLLLIPITRVLLTVILFMVQRDYIYLAITLIVSIILLGSFFFGKAL